jgi:UDP-N-acetylmuramoyl-tripeptide--D-alanyl-D-alanine ligase
MDLQRAPSGALVLDDSYNANPTSMAAALDALVALGGGGGRRYAVLGPMAELGPHAEEEHRRLGRLAAAAGVEAVVVVAATGPAPDGPMSSVMAALADGAREAGAEAVVVDGAEGALAELAMRLRAGDTVLVKASRVAGLERVAAQLLDLPVPRVDEPEPGGPGVSPRQQRREQRGAAR